MRKRVSRMQKDTLIPKGRKGLIRMIEAIGGDVKLVQKLAILVWSVKKRNELGTIS